MDGHRLAKGGRVLREAGAGLGAQAIQPVAERHLSGVVETRDLGLVELRRERDRRQACAVEDLVGVSVADAAEEPRVGERALQRVVLGEERGAEGGEVGCQHLDAARVERAQPVLAGDDVQRGALARARFGHEQRAGRELERGEPDFARDGRATRPPAQAAGDHQMEHEEELALERDHDALAEPARGDDRAQEKRARQLDALERVADDACRQALAIELDVGQLGHRPSARDERARRLGWCGRQRLRRRGRRRWPVVFVAAIRHHDPEREVDDDAHAAAEERAQEEGQADDRDRDAELVGEAGADAGEHLAVAAPVPRARERAAALDEAAAVAALARFGADLFGAIRAELHDVRHGVPRVAAAPGARREAERLRRRASAAPRAASCS